MPTKTNMLDCANFVYSPQSPMNKDFREYLDNVDRLLQRLHQAETEPGVSPFSPELKQCRRELADYISPFKGVLTAESVERIPAFTRVSQFFAQYHPIRDPFSVLHCSLDIPLHTAMRFQTRDDLAALDAALDERTPLRWWQNGPTERPCYLFGQCVWELKPSEITASEEGLALLFLEAAERDRQKADQLRHKFSRAAGGVLLKDPIPKDVRMAVWRRDRGRCVKCGSYKQLDFEHVVPLSQGGSNTAENVQLLCERCRSNNAPGKPGG